MASTRLLPDRAEKGKTDNDMDQGVYTKSSNPLPEADPRRDGNQTGGPYRHAPPPSGDPISTIIYDLVMKFKKDISM